ncbi:class I SAM-dependent methyltransferase [Aliiroseovarius sp. 2305UL8-7]|uniref:class I SAM-dependent methyltransferase n=1 Tax=Aliiroseovarius conchicola TaxID=3121637 RepID=UPI00352917B6
MGEKLFPDVVRDIETGRHSGRHIRLKRAILYSRSHRAMKTGNEDASESSLHQFWQTDTANDYYLRYGHRFQDWFLGPHLKLVEQIEDYAQRNLIEQMIEIGCGDGRVLDYCSKRLTGTKRFTGLDINPMIISANQKRYEDNPALSFVAGNAQEWVPKNTGPGTLLFTYGGVLEYFSQRGINQLFSRHTKQHGSLIALVEPLDPKHDLTKDHDSRIFGQENSFSHNYRHILEKLGYHVRFEEEHQMGPIRWIMMMATNSKPRNT